MRSLDFNRYRFSINGLLFGAAVGAGFAAFESAGYALRSGFAYGSAGMVSNIILRGFFSPFNHAVWSAISVCAFWRARQFNNTNTETLFDSRFLIIFIIPCILHFCWNYNYEMPYYSKYFIIGIIGWGVVFRLYQDGLKQIEKTLITLKEFQQSAPPYNVSQSHNGWLLSGIMPDGKMIKFNVSLNERKYIIGRDASADFILNDTSVSRQHCTLLIMKGRILVNDLGSTNGTYINDEPLGENAKEVRISDLMTIGSIKLSLSFR